MTLLSEILTTGGGDVGDFKVSLNPGPKWLQANGGKAVIATYPALAALCSKVPGTASAPVVVAIPEAAGGLSADVNSAGIERFAGKLCVLVQGYYHFSANDGATWSERTYPPQTVGGYGSHNRLQVVGDFLFAYTYGGFAWSTDGVTFTDNGLQTNQTIKGGALLAGSYYTVHASGTVFRSGTPAAPMIQDAVYGVDTRHALGFKGRFVMACANKVMSFDPATKAYTQVAAADAWRIATDGEYVYAVTYSGEVWRSADGLAWALSSSLAIGQGTGWALSATPGLLVAALAGNVTVSYDYGVTWSAIAANPGAHNSSLLVETAKAFLINASAWRKITFTRAASTQFYLPARPTDLIDPAVKLWIKAK